MNNLCNSFLAVAYLLGSYGAFAAVVDNPRPSGVMVDKSVPVEIKYGNIIKGFVLTDKTTRDSFIRNELRKVFNIADMTKDLILTLDGKSLDLNEHGRHPRNAEGIILSDFLLKAANQIFKRPIITNDVLVLTLKPKPVFKINLLRIFGNLASSYTISFDENAPVKRVYTKIKEALTLNDDNIQSVKLKSGDKEVDIKKAYIEQPLKCISCLLAEQAIYLKDTNKKVVIEVIQNK